MTIGEVLTLIGVPAIISGFVVAIGIALYNKWKNKRDNTREERVLLRLGVQALLRNELLSKYEFYMKQKWISIDNKANYDNMYKRYHSLGQNGVMDHCYEEIMELPTEKPETVRKIKNNKNGTKNN